MIRFSMHVHIHIYIYTYIHTYIYIYSHTHTHTYIYTHIHIYIYIYLYTHIRTHTHIYIFTIHIYIYTCNTLLTGKERRDQANLCGPAFSEAAGGGPAGGGYFVCGSRGPTWTRNNLPLTNPEIRSPKIGYSPNTPQSVSPKQRFSVPEDPLDQNKRPGCGCPVRGMREVSGWARCAALAITGLGFEISDCELRMCDEV